MLAEFGFRGMLRILWEGAVDRYHLSPGSIRSIHNTNGYLYWLSTVKPFPQDDCSKKVWKGGSQSRTTVNHCQWQRGKKEKIHGHTGKHPLEKHPQKEVKEVEVERSRSKGQGN